MFKNKKAVILGAGLIFNVWGVQAAYAAVLLSHHAGYSIRMNTVRDTAVVSNVSGKIAYGIENTCNGWLLQQSGTMNLEKPSGEIMPQNLQFSSVEQGDMFRFSLNSNGNPNSAVMGHATMPHDGKEGRVVFNDDKKTTFVLPPNTLFPVEHTQLMIDNALAGKKQFQSYIFEGTNIESAKLLSVFVNPLTESAKAISEGRGKQFKGHVGWNFRMAYFDPKSKTGEPMYEVEVDLFDNGIAPRWVLDYQAFTVEMKMVKFQALDKPQCG